MEERPPIDLVRPTSLAAGVPYAYAAAPHGRSLYVFTAGACPLDGAGDVVAADLAAQSAQVMDNLAVALRGAGAELNDVVKATVYVASAAREDLVTAWRVVRDRFGDHDPPSTLLGVTVLGFPGQLVEVEAVAALPQS
jgi:enamine deaminase RidA (YjgF/YER057c/UK114 family)